ncbi:MAG: L-serine ammonia-lyase, iron-sulfur-dependent subunit beta [Synergistaceae bacterium]
MPIWDIIGPVMIGPSSSHTAGAVRLGKMALLCNGNDIKKVDIYMRGSFATTGSGHGTDKALVAGLLGFEPDDPRVRNSFDIATENGMDFSFYTEDVDGAHPNSVRFVITNNDSKKEIIGSSVGGGAINLEELDGFRIDISGTLPVVIIINKDVHGVVGAVTSYLSSHDINIATMKLQRNARGGLATMVIEVDKAGSSVTLEEITASHKAIVKAIGIKEID